MESLLRGGSSNRGVVRRSAALPHDSLAISKLVGRPRPDSARAGQSSPGTLQFTQTGGCVRTGHRLLDLTRSSAPWEVRSQWKDSGCAPHVRSGGPVAVSLVPAFLAQAIRKNCSLEFPAGISGDRLLDPRTDVALRSVRSRVPAHRAARLGACAADIIVGVVPASCTIPALKNARRA